MEEYIQALININNLLVGLHPTGDDIIQTAGAIVAVRQLLDKMSKEKDRGEADAEAV